MSAVVVAARRWLGTPYRHQASMRGEGADCLGLVRGVWREVAGEEPETAPAYRPDWAEVGGEETLLHAARRWLVEIPLEAMRAGDVVLFRMAPGAPAKHCGILSFAPGAASSGRDASLLHPSTPSWSPSPSKARWGGDGHRMIHAYWGRAVVESWLGVWWRRRLVAAFKFPGGETWRS